MSAPRRGRRLAAALLAVLACGLAAAQEPQGSAGTAALRLVHLSPDAPRIDLQLRDAAVVRDLAFGRASDYVRVPAGQHTVRVFPHRLPGANGEGDAAGDPAAEEGGAGGAGGAPPADEALPRLEPITLVVTFEAGAYYSLALVGFYEPPPENQNGSLSIDVTPDDASVTVRGPRGYQLETSGDTLEDGLEPGEYTIDVSAPGFRAARSQVQVEELKTQVVSVSLQQGEEGDPDAPPLEEGSVVDSASGWNPTELQLFRDLGAGLPPANHALVRVVHVAPITVPVDVLWVEPGDDEAAGSVLVADGLAFPNDSDYVPVPPSATTLEVRVAGREEPLLEIAGYGLSPGSVVTLFVVGDLGESEPRVVPLVDALVLTEPTPP